MADEQYNEQMRGFAERHVRNRVTRIVGWIVKFIVFAIIAIFVFGQIVYRLWNWLLPGLFHFPAITFWQAVGLMVLCWMLFGGLRGFGRGGPRHRGPWGREMWQRWQQMSPEEREKFREWMRQQRRPQGAPQGNTP